VALHHRFEEVLGLVAAAITAADVVALEQGARWALG